MIQYLFNNHWILDTGDHAGFATTLRASRYIDIVHTLQALRPGHGPVALFGCFVFALWMGATLALNHQ
jgi:hypothetical protein